MAPQPLIFSEISSEIRSDRVGLRWRGLASMERLKANRPTNRCGGIGPTIIRHLTKHRSFRITAQRRSKPLEGDKMSGLWAFVVCTVRRADADAPVSLWPLFPLTPPSPEGGGAT